MNDAKKTFWFLVFLFLSGAVYTYWRTAGIIGPFIFADELLYFSAAKSIHATMTFPAIAYNPLYSFLASFAVTSDIVQSYEMIRVMNAVLFASMVFPFFYISSSFFGPKISFLLTGGIILMPWGSITAIIWAEPLFYCLYAWTIFVFLSFVKTRRILFGVLLGVFLAVVFLTKQSGIVLAAAVIMALLYDYFFIDRQRRNLTAYLMVLLVLLAAVAPWLVRNACYARVGLLGQPERISKFSTFSPFTIDYMNFAVAFFYQLTYLSISTYLVFLLVFVYSLLKIKLIPKEKRSFMILLLFAVSGTLFLNTLHRYYSATDETVFHLTYGRYMAPLIPLIIIAGFYTAKTLNIRAKDFLLLSGAGILLTILTVIYSPLNSLGAYSIVNSADTAYLNYFTAPQVGFDWGNRIECTLTAKTYLGVFWFLFTVFILVFLKLRLLKYTAFIIMVPIVYTGIYSDWYIKRVATSDEHLNFMERHLLESDAYRKPVFFDSQERTTMFNYVHSFWCGEKPQFLSFFAFPMVFDFGTKNSPVKNGAVPVTAPWDEFSSYTQAKGWGFTDIFNIDARHKIQRLFNDGSEDFVFGTKRQEFRIDCPPGEYNLSISADLANSLITEDVDYNLVVNGEILARMLPDMNSQIDKSVHVTNYGDHLSIFFEPVKDFWVINELRLSAESDIPENLRDARFVTQKDVKTPALLDEERISFDFGTPASPVKQGAIKVAAPWDASAAYISSKGWGFTDIYNIDSYNVPDIREFDGTEDFIFGTKTKEFRIDCPPGFYTIEMHLTPDMEIEEMIEFLVTVNGSKSIQVTPEHNRKNTWVLNVQNDQKYLSIEFSPVRKFWALNLLEIAYKRETSFDNPLWHARRQKIGEFSVFSWQIDDN